MLKIQQPWREKVNEMFPGLKKQQSVLTCSPEISDAAVKTSNIIANKIVVALKSCIREELGGKGLLEEV